MTPQLRQRIKMAEATALEDEYVAPIHTAQDFLRGAAWSDERIAGTQPGAIQLYRLKEAI